MGYYGGFGMNGMNSYGNGMNPYSPYAQPSPQLPPPDQQPLIMVNGEEGEKTRAMMQQNKIDALQARGNELYTSQQLCGIPKVNMSAWGTYPYAMPSGCNGGYYA